MGAYHPGRGAHNRTQSIARLIIYDTKVNVKLKASENNRRNRSLQLAKGQKGFETAKNRDLRNKEEQAKRAKRG